MISFTTTLTATPQSIAELAELHFPESVRPMIGDNDQLRANTIVQSISGTAMIGSPSAQDGAIVSGGAMNVERLNLNKTYLVGDGLDVVIQLFGKVTFGLS